MDILLFIVTLSNLAISLLSIGTEVYKKYHSHKNYMEINKKFIYDLKLIDDKMNSEKFEIIFHNNSYDINTKRIENRLFRENKNNFYIYIIMKYSYDLFSKIYNDKNIYCSIRIRVNKEFNTIAHFRCRDTSSIKERIYITDKNTDLINIETKQYDRFVVNNINDFKNKNTFTIQNLYLENMSKAIISIPIKDENELLGCYTIYFSKPLDDKIKLSNFKDSIFLLEKKLKCLIKDYLEINSEKIKLQGNSIIENKPIK